MKKMMFLLSFLLLSVFAFAQGVETGSRVNEFTIDLGTFAGIMALVSTVATQILKVVPAISNSKIAKIGVSVGVGIVVCVVSWGLQISEPLSGLIWWQVLVYGLAVGLSGCGFYDLVKVVWQLFGKKENN